jgi:hypothetical protein
MKHRLGAAATRVCWVRARTQPQHCTCTARRAAACLFATTTKPLSAHETCALRMHATPCATRAQGHQAREHPAAGRLPEAGRLWQLPRHLQQAALHRVHQHTLVRLHRFAAVDFRCVGAHCVCVCGGCAVFTPAAPDSRQESLVPTPPPSAPRACLQVPRAGVPADRRLLQLQDGHVGRGLRHV